MIGLIGDTDGNGVDMNFGSDPTMPGGADAIGTTGNLNVKTGVSQAINPWSREDMLIAGSRTVKGGLFATETGLVPAPVKRAIVAAPAPPSEGIPRGVVIAGAAVLGLGIIGAIAYKLRKRR